MHSKEIHGKVVLVTGGASGLGAEFVKAFIEKDAEHVRFLDVDESNGITLERKINEQFNTEKAKFVKCDVTDDSQLSKAFDDLIREKKIDVVVNNAGLMNDSEEVYRKMIEINFTALVTSTLKAFNHMRTDKGGVGGTIMNVASQLALQNTPFVPIYNGTKAAVLQFSQCIGMEPHYSRSKVRLITLCFGATDTSLIHLSRLKGFDAETDELLELLPRTGQSPQSAVQGAILAFERGGCPSVFTVINGKCTDVTDNVNQGYDMFSMGLEKV